MIGGTTVITDIKEYSDLVAPATKLALEPYTGNCRHHNRENHLARVMQHEWDISTIAGRSHKSKRVGIKTIAPK